MAARPAARTAGTWLRALGWSTLCAVALSNGVAAEPALELVQTWPVETPELRDPDLRDAHVVWREMIDGSTATLDFAHFYASNNPASRLEDVIGAIERAAARGVRVRFLTEKGFVETYPETLRRLDAVDGIEVRIYDVRSLMGGVLHAKFLIVDAAAVFVGSQNFDWRALEHIQELGLRIVEPAIAGAYQRVFEADWALAGGADRSVLAPDEEPAHGFPVTMQFGDGPVRLTPVFSPDGWLPDPSSWDLDRLVGQIEGARARVRVQLLSYQAAGRGGEYWPVLENALRAAAARGVEVQLLLSHWETRASRIAGLKSLQCLPGIEVRILTVPEWSGGYIPYARVIHSKYMVVDGEAGWVGTSNWQRGYFHSGRNAGIVFEGKSMARALDRYFERGWTSRFAETVDPGREYPEPRRGE